MYNYTRDNREASKWPPKNLYENSSSDAEYTSLSSADASDPSPLQYFCICVNTPANGVFVNEKFCKDPKLATAYDFFFTGLNRPRTVTNAVGFNVAAVNVNQIQGLNTILADRITIGFESKRRKKNTV
ncbi:predicted protein [Arabidopsis lyrata subsp. lyrata]|uniref:Predicted protein n=1 Tax=Arabidopsis lyrata subsp. lyrata TaxID=81972 RepID=D7MJS8_ARALL|nr:predicted protein [Arabidopsis lyrata subsp. lyrata]